LIRSCVHLRETEKEGEDEKRTIAGIGPKTGKILTRKFDIACNSSTLPFWNSSSGRGRRPRSGRGFSVEYCRDEKGELDEEGRVKGCDRQRQGRHERRLAGD
jgi:hypothetical protein